MDMGNILGNLKLDIWYKVLIVVGSICLAISFFVELPPNGLNNGQLQSISVGVILIGLGFWKCRGEEQAIQPPNAYYGGQALLLTRTYHEFDIFGFLMILGGIFLIVNAFTHWL